tara:strand:+ start:1250 stop:1723 length:474 start_codon:yes stop_codon:yes gene_type:complete
MDKESRDIGIKIQEIKEVSFFNKVNDELVKNFDDEKVDVKLGYAVKGEFEKSIISIGIVVHFISNSKVKKPLEFLKLETNTSFKIQNFTDDDVKFIDGNNEIFINDELMYVFLNTAIGATRGMFAYKIASLPINICLPLFDMNQLIPKNKSKKKVKE